MAHDIDEHDFDRDLKIDFTGAAASANHPLIVALDEHARRLAAAIVLKEITIIETAPGVLTYHIESQDAREFGGVLDFTGDPNNPTITGASVGAGWSFSEVEPIRGFRAAWMLVRTVLGANGFSFVVLSPP